MFFPLQMDRRWRHCRLYGREQQHHSQSISWSFQPVSIISTSSSCITMSKLMSPDTPTRNLTPPHISSPVELEFCKRNLEHSPLKVNHCLVVLPGLVSWRLLHVLPAAPRHDNHSAPRELAPCIVGTLSGNYKITFLRAPAMTHDGQTHKLSCLIRGLLSLSHSLRNSEIRHIWEKLDGRWRTGRGVLLPPLWKNSASPLTNYVLIMI